MRGGNRGIVAQRERTRIATGDHRQINALSSFVGSYEQRGGGRRERARVPEPLRVIGPRLSCDSHASHLAGDHVRVADHEASNGGDDARHAQVFESMKNLRDGSGGPQQDRSGEAQGGLGDNGPRRPQSFNGERHAPEVDSFALADEGQEDGEEKEGNLQPQPAGDEQQRYSCQPGGAGEEHQVEAASPQRLAGRGDYYQHEQKCGHDLALRCQLVDRAVSVDEQPVRVSSAQGCPSAGFGAWDARRRRSAANDASPTPKVSNTPIRPDNPLPTPSSSTPRTA